MAESLRLEKPLGEPSHCGHAPLLVARGLSVAAGSRPILDRVELTVPDGAVLAIVGPSGAGKSTLLKCFNRLIDLEEPALSVSGSIGLDGGEILAPSCDVDALRATVGMIFQQPVVFPASIYDNVLFGARRRERLSAAAADQRVETTLRAAALWEEVRDRLAVPAAQLSVGQQQRLCLARTLAVRPRMLLMDEPTSALDRSSKAAIEARIRALGGEKTIVLVTHDLAQARRTADLVAYLEPRPTGARIVEVAACERFFSRPRQPETAAFLDQE